MMMPTGSRYTQLLLEEVNDGEMVHLLLEEANDGEMVQQPHMWMLLTNQLHSAG